MKGFAKSLILLMVISLLAGCYRNRQVSESQMAVIMPEGNKVESVVGPGRYSSTLNRFAAMEVIDVSSKILQWDNDDLVTSDTQIIGISIVLTVQRSRSENDIRLMWSQYRTEATDDEALTNLVFSRLSRAAKNATAQLTLDEMLGVEAIKDVDASLDTTEAGRNYLAAYINRELSENLKKAGITLVDIGVSDINPSSSYRDSLDRKAKANADTDVIRQETIQTQQLLAQEQANTEIELEKARRERLVAEENAKVLVESVETYELEKLKIVMNALGKQDKIYFVPEGADISLFLNGNTPIIKEGSE